MDACIEQAKQDAIACTLETLKEIEVPVLPEIYYLLCLEELKRRLAECDRRAKADTHCPDSPPATETLSKTRIETFTRQPIETFAKK